MGMKRVVIRRRWQLPAALLPYRIVVSRSKRSFMQLYHLPDDLSCETGRWGRPIPRLAWDPAECGLPLKSGKTLILESDAAAMTSVFAVTPSGLLSNEILLGGWPGSYRILVTTRGGWKTPPHPVLTLIPTESEWPHLRFWR